jgi:hypothetical protein
VEAPATETREEERRQLRPYRRFVRVVFFVLMGILCFIVLNGIIRSLDRLPSTPGVRPEGPVDVRALRACAEDLERLEKRLRIAAGELLSSPPDAPAESWQTFAQPYEMERLTIVARCNLEADSNDPVVRDLKTAASALEDLARSYALLYDRHKESGAPRAKDAAEALRRATEALKTRR